jgi:hypothetical protein
MNLLATDLDAHLAHAAAAGVDVLVLGPATMAESRPCERSRDAEHARYLERDPQPEPQTALPEAA